MDGDITNDFTNADGAESDLDASSETLFNEFGQSWMIHEEDLSLFRNLAGSAQAFSNLYAPEFMPIFEAPVLEGSELAAAEAACAFATTESIRRGCIFDIAVTGDVETFAAVTEITEAEQRDRVDVISNSLPQLTMSTVRLEVGAGEAASIDILASDAGGDVGLQ